MEPAYHPSITEAVPGNIVGSRLMTPGRLGRFIAVGLALGGITAPETSAEIANTQPTSIGLYTNTSPDAVTSAMQLALGQPISGEFNLGPNSQDQAKFNSIGSLMINSIPGNSVKFMQSVLQLSGTTSQNVSAELSCPASSSDASVYDFKSVEILQNDTASVTPCAANQVGIWSTVNTHNSSYAQAIMRYKDDYFRSGQPWIGNRYSGALFRLCPDEPSHQDTQLTFSYSSAKATVTVGFAGGNSVNYCDLMGRYDEQVSVLVGSDGSHRLKQLGQTVVHIDGLKEVLTYNYGLREPQVTKVQVPGVTVLCKPARNASVDMRIRLREEFTADHAEMFQGLPSTVSNLKSSTFTYLSKAKKVC